MNNDKELTIAVAAAARLEGMHRAFMDHMASPYVAKVNGGDFAVEENELSVTCLSKKLQSQHRLIARDGRLAAIEYPFFARHRDQDLLVWCMYLESDDSLYADAQKQTVICTSKNNYVASNVIEKLADALIRSAVFASLA